MILGLCPSACGGTIEHNAPHFSRCIEIRHIQCRQSGWHFGCLNHSNQSFLVIGNSRLSDRFCSAVETDFSTLLNDIEHLKGFPRPRTDFEKISKINSSKTYGDLGDLATTARLSLLSPRRQVVFLLEYLPS